MQAAPPSIAAAQPTLRGWLPGKAQLNMKSRLFSKNILYSRDIWARGTATWTSTCLFAGFLALTAYVLLLALTVARGSSEQTKPLRQLSTMLADDATINRLDHEIDSDEYEDEEQSQRSSGFLASSKEREVLRKMLARNEHGLSKRSSIVRITSSDPTSTLCENPMQVDLEPNTRRSFWPAPVSNTPPSDSSNPNSPTTASPALSASGSPTAAATRRRKESGRLLAADAGRRQHTASPSRSPLASGAALPVRPTRVRPVDARSPLGRTARNKRNSNSSLSSADGATVSPRPSLKKVGREESWTDEADPSPLSPDRDDAELLGTPSMASEASFASAAVGHAQDDDEAPPTPSACSSPTSSTFSISRAPSILKRRPQTFRTASLREIDISYSLMQRKASLPTLPMPVADPALVQHQQEILQANGIFLPLGAGSPAPPPYQPVNPELASSLPSETTKTRSIKLIEPDWRPHIDSHIRARERLETATRFAAFKMAAPGKFDDEAVDVDDFWFERFTQSTAAAGRDWDWRKRRARLQRAAALGMALGQSGLASPPIAANAALPGNVGKTDVQLQQQRTAAEALPAAQAASPVRKTLPSAPLITFTEQELQSAPVLKIDTETGRRAAPPRDANASPSVSGTPMSPTPSGTGTPLGGIFGAVLPSADTVSAVMAARMAQRRRASEDATAMNAAVHKINRRRLSASAAAGMPSSPGGSPSASPAHEGLGASPLRELASSPLSQSDAVPNSTIPGRLSSLGGTVGKKVSLTNLRAGLRRNSGSGGTDFLQDSSGIELVPNSPDLSREDEGMRYLDETPSPEGPRSSADMYRSAARASEDVPRPVPVTRLGSAEPDSSPRGASSKKPTPPLFVGASTFSRQASAPSASTPSYNQHEILEELRADFDERDSGSQRSTDSSSDSLRRRLRARSQTDSSLNSDAFITRSSPITARKDGLAALSAGLPTSSPPVVRSRAHNGSRSSIMRSASGASSDLNRTAKRRSSTRLGSSDTSSTTSSIGSAGSRHSGSVRLSSSPKQTRAPDPVLQPEPAPRGMAQRARSASISSNGSSLASSRSGSRKNSFRDGQTTGLVGGLGLSMTASNPGTPADERRGDPFGMTALEA